MELLKKRCAPCERGAPPLSDSAEDALRALRALSAGASSWKIDRMGVHRLIKAYSFSSFPDAVSFVNSVAIIAEREQHHPVIKISYRTVEITCTTHATGGLSENDFILAAKIDEAYSILTKPAGVFESAML